MTTKEDLIKSLEKVSKSLDRLKTYSKFVNRSRIMKKDVYHEFTDEFENYFYDLIDDGWKVIPDYGSYYIHIFIRKPIKIENAENGFNWIVDRMNEIKDRLIEEKFNPHFMIFFNERGQQNNNPETHRNDVYVYKGVGEKEYLHGGIDQYKDRYPSDEYFLCRVEFYII